MKTEIKFPNLLANNDFVFEDMEPLKLFITNQLHKGEIQPGIIFVFQKIHFQVFSVLYDIDNLTKVIILNQLNTMKKSVIEKPNLITIPNPKN